MYIVCRKANLWIRVSAAETLSTAIFAFGSADRSRSATCVSRSRYPRSEQRETEIGRAMDASMRATLTERSTNERIREREFSRNLREYGTIRIFTRIILGDAPSLCQRPTRQRQTTNACFSFSHASPRRSEISISRQELGINNIWMQRKNFLRLL